jgi:hypothetical protein
MDTLNLIVDGLWIAALAIMAGASRQAYARILPDTQVPMQFGFVGQPTWRAPRLLAVSITPTVAAILWLSLVAATGLSDGDSLLTLGGKLALAPVLALIHLLHLRHALKVLGDEGQLRG